MKGNWIYSAIAATLGITATFVNYHPGLLLCTIIFLLWIYMNGKNNRLLFICIVILTIFAISSKWVDDNNQTHLTGDEENFIGEVASIPKFDGRQLSFIYKLPSKEKLQIFYYVSTVFEKDELEKVLTLGMTCKLEGRLELPNTARNQYGFDYQSYLKKQRIHWILSPKNISTTNCFTSSTPNYILSKWRASQLHFIKENFPENTIGIVQALLFGERELIDPLVEKQFQTYGIIHLLAISGLHVGLIVAVMFFGLIRIGLTRERTFLLLVSLLPLYMIVAGAAPSVIRACLVTMLVLISLRYSAAIVPLDALSFAYLFMLFINPYYITQVGFLLSFLVSFSLIVSSTKILAQYKNRLLQVLVVTTIAQLSSLPIMYYYFYEISLLSLLFNVLMVPLVSIIILPLSFLAYFGYYLFPPIGDFLGYTLSTLLELVFYLLNHVPISFTLTLGRPPVSLLVAYYISIIMLFRSWERNYKLKLHTSFLMVIMIIHGSLPYLSNEGSVTIIDVGQGDSILIELPNRKAVYLIDTGGTYFSGEEEWEQRRKSPNVGENVILPLLKAKGIRTIDKLILSHEHLDHIGGATAILNSNVHVRQMMIRIGETESEAVLEVYRAAYVKDIPIVKVRSGDSWKVGEYEFNILAPMGDEMNENNRSLVLYTMLGGLSWLLTGDLESEGELKLISRFPHLKADVLKIGHHGSKTSTSKRFLEVIQPKFALISVGDSNRFGHPNDEVTSLLMQHNVRILRTDENGAISYNFNENIGTFSWIIP